ncbi:MAG: Maf family protein [Clostridiales Family XIII bacterium]|jgi:septum formation protein|nr:Maf family protein [Clostridiales Family XIII bacterium]
MKLLLASKSPRRYEILAAHGVEPVVMPPRVDEDMPSRVASGGPASIVRYLAEKKALDVFERIRERRPPGALDDNPGAAPGDAPERLPHLLVAADTIVWCDRLIGKPADELDAFLALSSYRNRAHEVWSGVSLVDLATGDTDTFAVCTRVTMGDYSDDDIWRYIREERPFDKAGSYAIQSSWGAHVISVDGDYENVIGFPWPVVKAHLIPLLKNVARRELPERTREWAARMGVRPTKVSVGSARKRWGSCKQDGGIRYTWRIMLGNERLVDYLVVHELAHLKQMNHSKRFWAVVEAALPDFKARRKELRALYNSIESEGWG